MCRSFFFLVFLGLSLGAAAAPKTPTSKPAAVCQPQEAANACEACHESNCCIERRACEKDPSCAAFLICMKKGCPSPPCVGQCGAVPKPFVARFACQMEKCNTEVCGGPVDACSLCSSTQCAGPTLACLHQADCGARESCLADCGKDIACVGRCPKVSAAALPVWEAKESCVKKKCGDLCR